MKAGQFYQTRYARTGQADRLNPRLQRVVEYAQGFRAPRLLDVGCGDGAFTLALKQACQAKESYGIELSEDAVSLARARGVITEIVDVSSDPFPFEDGYFDLVFAG